MTLPLSVFKYEIPVEAEPVLMLPVGARLLHFEAQYGKPILWAMVDPDAALEQRRFRLIGTGHEITGAGSLQYVGTCLLQDGALVLHLFEYV